MEQSGRFRVSGFTLIELLVVVSIIALLIGLLVPSLSASRRMALRMECAVKMQQQGVAYHGYTADRDRRMLLHWMPGDSPIPDSVVVPHGRDARLHSALPNGSDFRKLWAWVLAEAMFPDDDFTILEDLFLCPSHETVHSGSWLNEDVRNDAWKTWQSISTDGSETRWMLYAGSDSSDKPELSYGYNIRLGTFHGSNATLVGEGHSIYRVQASSRVVLFGETDGRATVGKRGYMLTEDAGSYWFGRRHEGGGNAVYLDGHVKFHMFDEMVSNEPLDEAFFKFYPEEPKPVTGGRDDPPSPFDGHYEHIFKDPPPAPAPSTGGGRTR